MNIHLGVWEGESEVKSNLETQIPAGFCCPGIRVIRQVLDEDTGGRRWFPPQTPWDYLKEIYREVFFFFQVLSGNKNYYLAE